MSSEKDKATSSSEPTDRLTRLCAAMTDTLDAHPEMGEDVKCIIFLQGSGRGGIQIHGYDDYTEAVAELFVHLKAVFEANGKQLEVHAIGNRNDN